MGQLGWTAGKFKEWTDSGDRPEDAADRDQMLTNVTLYRLTGTAGSSARIYYERAHADYWGAPPEPSSATTALAGFPHDNFLPLRHLAERTDRIVRWTEYDRGGHFPAMEQPDLPVGAIRAFFRAFADRGEPPPPGLGRGRPGAGSGAGVATWRGPAAGWAGGCPWW